MSKNLKPKDLVVLLTILTWEEEKWTYAELGDELNLSSSQIQYALERLDYSHLFDKGGRYLRLYEIEEFVSHGVRYAFAARPGPLKRGTPAAMSAPVGKELFVSSGRGPGYIWPNPEGEIRGQEIEPLYDDVPILIERRPELYDWLALIDIIRIGSARERGVAAQEFADRILQ